MYYRIHTVVNIVCLSAYVLGVDYVVKSGVGILSIQWFYDALNYFSTFDHILTTLLFIAIGTRVFKIGNFIGYGLYRSLDLFIKPIPEEQLTEWEYYEQLSQEEKQREEKALNV